MKNLGPMIAPGLLTLKECSFWCCTLKTPKVLSFYLQVCIEHTVTQGQLRRWYFDRYMANTKANVLLPLSQNSWHVMCKTGSSRSNQWVSSGCSKGSGKSRVLLGSAKICVYIYIYMLDILLIPMRLSNKNAQWPQLFCRACHTDLLARWDYKRWLYRRWLCALWLSGAVASQGLRVANWARIQGNQWKYLPNHSSGHEKTGIIHWKTMIY